MSERATNRTARRWLGAALLALALWLGAGFVGAWVASAPRSRATSTDAHLFPHEVADVEVLTADGVRVRGWLATADAASTASERCVVLAAGIRGNRLAMLERARFYLERGWSALLVDLRGTGASEPARVSMGFHEANDLVAWQHWLRERGFRRIGAHGQSLGAAAIVYSAARATAWDFVVLESCYGDIDSALANRLPWVPLPRVLLWPLRASGEWWMDVDADRLRPIDAIGQLASPMLLACGGRDDKVGAGISEALCAACGARDKQLVLVPEAGHVDLWRAGPALPAALAAFLAAR